MGAWSHVPFGNDTSNDWAYELEGAKDLSYIDVALDRVLSTGDEYLEAPDAQEAVAAVEVIAKLLGKGTQSDSYTEKVDAWAKKYPVMPTAALRSKAQQVLRRTLAENSELRELWDESGEGNDWVAAIERLQEAVRLNPLFGGK